MTQTTKDVLLDVLKHMTSVNKNHIKVNGNAETTQFFTVADDRTALIEAKLHNTLDDFNGEFGIGKLGLLKSITTLSNYSGEGANIEVVRQTYDGVESPATFVFSDGNGSKDQFRLMSKQIVDDKIADMGRFKAPAWDIEFQPTVAKVQQLSEVAGIYAGIDPVVNMKTVDGSLVFDVGNDQGGLVGKRTFAENIDGSLSTTWPFRLETMLTVLKLGMSGICTMRLSDRGICQISIDSGLATYNYIFIAALQ